MQRFSTLVTLGILALYFVPALNAQTEARKARNDYRDDRVFRYQPEDPWTRSKLFKTHMGHGGRFYNCDGEEQKRYSPYICWKLHFENDLPPRQRFLDCLGCEIAEIKQRIMDGAGACYRTDSCNCDECQTVRQSQSYELGLKDGEVLPGSSVVQAPLKDPAFGLVRGKILGNSSESAQPQSVAPSNVVPVKTTPTRVASKSKLSVANPESLKDSKKTMMDRLRATNQRWK